MTNSWLYQLFGVFLDEFRDSFNFLNNIEDNFWEMNC